MRTIHLTEEQAQLLETLIEHELDEEFIYQADGSGDAEHYAAVLDLYKAIRKKPRNFIEQFALDDMLSQRIEELEEIKRVGNKA